MIYRIKKESRKNQGLEKNISYYLYFYKLKIRILLQLTHTMCTGHYLSNNFKFSLYSFIKHFLHFFQFSHFYKKAEPSL